MPIQQLNLGQGIDWNPMATISAMQNAAQDRQTKADEAKQRMQEGQLNIQRLQQMIDETKREHAENDQIRGIIAQGGDPQDVYKKILPVNPDKARTYLTNSNADTLQQQQQAELRAKTLEGQPGNVVPDTSPGNELPALGTPGTPQYQPAVPLGGTQVQPLPKVTIPFIGQPAAVVQPQTRQELYEAAKQKFADEQQAKAQAAIEEATAKAAAERAGKSDVKLDETYREGHRILRMMRPDNSQYEVDAGVASAAPQNPPQPQAPMSPERFKQELALEAAKTAASNEVPPLNFLKETSSTGVPFIDASKVEPKTLNALQTAAGKAGTKVVDKDTAQGLRDIATAKANEQSMMDLLNGRLPENPLSRILVAPENKLKALGQLDPNLAITGTFVGPAIQSLRAVAGGKNFRITKAEIDNAVTNFVPQASDTVDVAKAKMAALAHFMDNKERGALGISQGGGLDDALDRAFGKAK